MCIRDRFYFLLAGWFTSIVFVNMIYTLTVSFGDIGKAICVVLLVIQVAGSGGTFPIEMTPMFFQKLYVCLLYTSHRWHDGYPLRRVRRRLHDSGTVSYTHLDVYKRQM